MQRSANFYMKDMYPGMSGIETSTLANPETDDQDALNENTQASEKVDMLNPSTKGVFAGIGLILAIGIFLGM